MDVKLQDKKVAVVEEAITATIRAVLIGRALHESTFRHST